MSTNKKKTHFLAANIRDKKPTSKIVEKLFDGSLTFSSLTATMDTQ